MGSFLQNFENSISTFGNQLFGQIKGQRSSKVCIVCLYVCLLTNFCKIYTLDFSKAFSKATPSYWKEVERQYWDSVLV